MLICYWLVSVSLIVAFANAATDKPNVLFIVVDDLRASLGCYGGPIFSPNIDQLATQSAVFSNAMVQQAVCGPSRTSFLTGRRPDTTKLYDFGSYWREAAGNFTTIPQHFKDNGYFTASVGKVFQPDITSNYTDDYPYSWSIPAYHPSTEQYIFAKVCPDLDGSLHNNVVCPVNVSKMPEQSLPDLQAFDRAEEILKNLSSVKHNGAKNSSESFMDAPFFLAVGFRKPHLNWKYPEQFKDLYSLESIKIAPNREIPAKLPSVAWEDFFTARQRDDMRAMNLSFPYGLVPDEHHALMRRSYYAASSFVDYQVGRLLQALEDTGFADNTIISFIGDHGWQLGEHGEWCKYSNYEIATRVPLLVHMPGVTDIKHRASKKKFPLLDPFVLREAERKSKARRASVNMAVKKTMQVNGVNINEFVELVDLFPSLSEFAGLKVPPVCPPQPFKVDFCTEGSSFVPLVNKYTGLDAKVKFMRWKNATFSQYPRPGVTPDVYTDLPNLEIITIMGYSMLTRDHHYTEWIGFNSTTFKADWSDVKARELYIRKSDPLEDNNVADESEYKNLVMELSQQLENGWRDCQPVL